MADIIGPPDPPGQPYDAAATGNTAPWVVLPAGPVNQKTGQLTGSNFDDSPPWRQV